MTAALPCARWSTVALSCWFIDVVAAMWRPRCGGRRHDKDPRRSRRGSWWFDVRRALRRYLRLSPDSHREPVIRPISSRARTSSLPRRDTSTFWGSRTAHAPTITTDGDSGVFALSVWLTHVSRCSFRWRRRERTVHAPAGPCPAPPFVGYHRGRWSRPVAVADGPGRWCAASTRSGHAPRCRPQRSVERTSPGGSSGSRGRRDRLWRLRALRSGSVERTNQGRRRRRTSTWATNRSVERTEWAD